MNKKKLVKYTQWLLFEMEATPLPNKKVSKKIVNEFLKKHPEFLDKENSADNPQPLDEYHDWSYHGKKNDDPTEELFEKRKPNVYVVTTTGLFPNFWPRFFD